MSDVASISQTEAIVSSAQPTSYSVSNVDYRTDKDMLVISEKFYANLPSMNAIPAFSIKQFATWKDSIHSFLRGAYCLESLIDDDRELPPIQLESESLVDFQWRQSVFKRRDNALYLILDRSVTLGKELDPKFSALSTTIYKKSKSEGIFPGSVLFSELKLAVGGSHLHSRINLAIDAAALRMDKLGGEQSAFNKWRNIVDQMSSLDMDLEMLMKCLLIHGIGHVREHQSTMVSLASLSPEELRALSSQNILSRFLSSAEHAKGLRGPNPRDLALYTSAAESPRAPVKRGSAPGACFNCNKFGHIAAVCPDKKLRQSGDGSDKGTKRFKKT